MPIKGLEEHLTAPPDEPEGAQSVEALGAVEETARGFEIVNFKDRNGVDCSLQASSLADYETPGTSAVWLGCDRADPKVFVPYGNPSWQAVPMPEGYIANTRMHLSREQVQALICHLRNWLDTDSFLS